MRTFRLFAAIAPTLFLLTALGCAETPSQASSRSPAYASTTAARSAPSRSSPKTAPKTLALLPFENNSVTDPHKFAPLSQGIPAMLTTDLKRGGPGLRLIERAKIQSLLKETAFGQTGAVDESTAVKAGKILGAEAIGLGSFIVLGGKVRIDTRIIGVETSEVIMAESIMGDSDRFMELIQGLGDKIASAFRVNFTPAPAGSGGDIRAALYFSQGLEALDRNDRAAAERFFQKSIDLDPAYRRQVADALARTGAGSAPTGKSSPAASETAPASSGGNTRVVQAEGISFISHQDAVRQAQRAAVEQAVGVFIQSETEVRNFEVQKDRIFSRTQGYITRYQTLKSMEADGQHIVTIRAEVSLDKIKDDLIAMKILLDSMERPTLMVLIEEQYLGMGDPGMDVAETEMTAVLKEKGFDLVDKGQLARARKGDQARQALAGNRQAAKQLGFSMGAQYLILGKAAVENAGEAYAGSGLYSLQAGLNLRVLQTQTGLILGSVVRNGAAAHARALTGASLALREAARKAANDYLVSAITDSFQDFLNNGAPVKLHIAGVRNFQDYQAVADAVDGLDKVVSARKEGWNQAGGLLILDLRFRGTSEELAVLIDGKTVAGYRLEVNDFAPERVNASLNRR